ncbi:MAG: sensor histidine kinase RegB [Paracoccaceae bacterium]
MRDSPGTPASDHESPFGRNDRVHVRTLIALRWTAVLGQTAAIAVASFVYGLRIDVPLCLSVVAAAVLFNLGVMFVNPVNRRLTERGAVLTFLFDTAQLAVLLVLTGGLTNPFALLILAPVSVAAAALRPRAAYLVGAVTVAMVTAVAVFHFPLRLADGSILGAPPLIEFGFWIAIVIGVVFLGLYAQRVSTEIRVMGEALLATQMALAREQKLTDLGGVVAAAAHEMGTPLATIKLTSGELAELLKNEPELQRDAELIRAQAERCGEILRSMGSAGKDDRHLRSAPLSEILREVAEPHHERGKLIEFTVPARSPTGTRQPFLTRRPEIIHGLRNLVQNAVDFAASTVWIEAHWSSENLLVTIADDGTGFPADVLRRIGDPFLHRRLGGAEPHRPGYEGMGLGLFIAKTLLERTGAELRFANGGDPFLKDTERPKRSGAVVEVSWPLSAIGEIQSAASGNSDPDAAGP